MIESLTVGFEEQTHQLPNIPEAQDSSDNVVEYEQIVDDMERCEVENEREMIAQSLLDLSFEETSEVT